jgi:hypothetical protein
MMRYYCTLNRVGKVKTVIIPNAGKDAKKLDYSYIAGENKRYYSYSVGSFL